jgi:hypothetical protein
VLAGTAVATAPTSSSIMDLLEQHHETIEREVFWRTCDLLAARVDLIFYDTTTLHCEIEEEDAREGFTPRTVGQSAAPRGRE